jgi:hypothetical protein
MTTTHEVTYVAELPPCDFCPPSSGRKAVIDGKTKAGPWANMCSIHYGRHGVGLGLGHGQRLELKQ